MAKRNEAAAAVKATFGRSGTCRVYGPGGEVLWQCEGFVVGRDRVPRRLSLVMLAMQVVDPATGERVAQWNPWGVLAD